MRHQTGQLGGSSNYSLDEIRALRSQAENRMKEIEHEFAVKTTQKKIGSHVLEAIKSSAREAIDERERFGWEDGDYMPKKLEHD